MRKCIYLVISFIFGIAYSQLFSRTVKISDTKKEAIFRELYSSYSDQIGFEKMKQLEDSLALKHITNPKMREQMLEIEASINSQCGTGRHERIQKIRDITTKEFYDEFSFLIDEIILYNKKNAKNTSIIWMKEKFSSKTNMTTLLDKNNWEKLKRENVYSDSVIGIVFHEKLLYMVVWPPKTDSTDIFRYKISNTNKKWNLIK